MKRFLASLGLAVLSLCQVPMAHASDSRVGSGGYGVMVDGRLHSLDLAMRGVQVDPYLSENVTDRLKPELQEILAYHLDRIVPPSVRDLVERKLVEIDKRTTAAGIPYTVDGLVKNMDRYRWIALPDLTCTDVGDDQTPFPNKIQLAYRKDMWVRFCRDAVGLQDADLAALTLHEIVYALHTDATTFVPQLVGLVFSDDFKDFRPTAANELRAIVNGLTGAGSAEPATLFVRLKALYSGGLLPSSSEFQTDALWNGRCVDDRNPDAVRGALLYTFYSTDPIFGPIVKIVPLIAPFGSDRFQHSTPEDLATFRLAALKTINEDNMTGVREPDFSWTGSVVYPYNSDVQGSTFYLRRTISPTGDPMYMLRNVYDTERDEFNCYFNVKAS